MSMSINNDSYFSTLFSSNLKSEIKKEGDSRKDESCENYSKLFIEVIQGTQDGKLPQIIFKSGDKRWIFTTSQKFAKQFETKPNANGLSLLKIKQEHDKSQEIEEKQEDSKPFKCIKIIPQMDTFQIHFEHENYPPLICTVSSLFTEKYKIKTDKGLSAEVKKAHPFPLRPIKQELLEEILSKGKPKNQSFNKDNQQKIVQQTEKKFKRKGKDSSSDSKKIKILKPNEFSSTKESDIETSISSETLSYMAEKEFQQFSS
jgi:hypothetical protein